MTRPFRFFFNNLSEDERQVPCCTSTDGDEVELSEEASETDECRQCTDEERRFPRLATSRPALLTSLTINRFFFGLQESDRQLPCCTEAEESSEEEATTTGETTEEVSDGCRQCSDEEAGRWITLPHRLSIEHQNNRFFWATQSVEDMNDLPCCNRIERRRLANATDCGQKPYHNRILGGIKSKVSEE